MSIPNQATKRMMEDDSSQESAKVQKPNTCTAVDLLDELFSQPLIPEETVEDRDPSYLTIPEFSKGRLNCVKSTPVTSIKTDIGHFNQYLSQQLNDCTLESILSTVPPKEQYQITYSFLVQYFIEQCQGNDIIHHIFMVLKGLIVHKENTATSTFGARIDGIAKSSDIDMNKIKHTTLNYIQSFLKKCDNRHNEESVEMSDNMHFGSLTDLYDNVVFILNTCNKITKLSTPKTVNFKQLQQIKAEVGKANGKKPVLAKRVIFDKPMMVKLTTRKSGDNFTFYALDEEESATLVEKIGTAMLFEREGSNKRLSPRFFPNVNVGEFQKKMNVLKLYEVSPSKSIVPVNKDAIHSDMFIVIDGINLLRHDNIGSFGISLKCWPKRMTLDDEYINGAQFSVVDLTINQALFDFLK